MGGYGVRYDELYSFLKPVFLICESKTCETDLSLNFFETVGKMPILDCKSRVLFAPLPYNPGWSASAIFFVWGASSDYH